MPPRRFIWWHIAVLMAVSFAAYATTLRNGFVTDDNTQILQNPQVKEEGGWTKAFAGDVWSFAAGAEEDRVRGSNYFRPAQILTYSLEYSLFGDNPRGWHLVNVLLNLLVVGAVYLVAFDLAGGSVAFLAGIVFALHPMHTEPVAWIAALPELECALFLLLAFLLYRRATFRERSISKLAASALLYSLALLSKEAALLFPAILVAYEWLYCETPVRQWRRWLVNVIPFLGVLILYIGLRVSALGGFSPRAESLRGFLSPAQLFWAVPPLFARYIGKLLAPVGMNYFYAFPAVTKFSLVGCLYLLFLLGFVLATLLLRKRWPLLAFSMAWFFFTIVPALSLNSIGENFFTERYLYIPSAGFSLAVAWIGIAIWNKSPGPSGRILLSIAASLILAFSAVQIERRIPVFHDDFSLYERTIQQSPDAYIVQAGFASAYNKRGNTDQALEHELKAIELNPGDEMGQITLAGYLSDKGRYDEAIAHLEVAVRMHPEYDIPLVNLAKVYTLKREWQRARETYQRAAEVKPERAKYFLQLAANAEAARQSEEKLKLLESRASANPRDAGASMQLGDVYAEAGLWKQAAASYDVVARLLPRDPVAEYKLGVALTRAGNYQEANTDFRNLLRENPRWEHADQVHALLGANAEKTGDRQEAIREYQAAASLNPGLQAVQQRLSALQGTGTVPAK